MRIFIEEEDASPSAESALDSLVGTRLRGADLIAEALIAIGVAKIFGVPGDTGVAFYDALFTRTDKLQHVLARDERHAAFMADAYARVANRLAVVEVSSGGGATFVVGGLGEAYAAGVPVLLITSDIHSSSRNTGALTEIDQEQLFAAVTKWRRMVRSADELPEVIAEAATQAVTGRPAPVAVIVPEDVLDEHVAVTEKQAASVRGVNTWLPGTRPTASAAAVQAVAERLTAAKRPAILAGSGVHVSEAWEQIDALAKRAGIPVATSIHGKGAVSDENPWSLGVAGNNGGRGYTNDYLSQADFVLLVGTRANATDTSSWTGPARTGVAIAQIDIEVERAGRNFPEAVALVGDVALVLEQLIRVVEPVGTAVAERRLRKIRDGVTAWRVAGPEGKTDVRDGQLVPSEIIRAVRDIVGSEATVVADPGTPTPNVASYWHLEQPGRTAIIPRGHGPMGYAIPAAVGASFARPGIPVVSVTADGSFAMACGELETVSRFRLPVLYIQLTNHSLGWIKMLQHLYTGGRYFAVDPGTIDAIEVARASGIESARVSAIAELEERVRSFAADPRPMYLDMEVPHMINYTPPVPFWLSALDGDTERPVY